MPQSPRSVAFAFIDAINAHDLDTLAGLMSDAHRFIDSLGTVVQGREQMRKGWADYFRMVPDYKVVVQETFSHGSPVVLLGLAKGTYAKQGHVSPENVRQTPAAWRAHVKDDKLTEWSVYADNEPIRRLMAESA